MRVGKNEAIYQYLAANHPDLVEDDYFTDTAQHMNSIFNIFNAYAPSQ